MKEYTTEVTAVNVYPFREGPICTKIKGLATIVINDCLLVRGLRVVDGENGLFVGYPNDPFYKGDKFNTIVNPLKRALREEIENKVLEAYQNAVNG